MLLGALMRELPDVFKTEVLSKLNLDDHAKLLFVNKECKDFVCNLPPIDFMRALLNKWPGRVYDGPYNTPFLLLLTADAAMEGRLDVLKLIMGHWRGCGFEYESAVYHAALHGHKHVLDWYLVLPREGLEEGVAKYLGTLQGSIHGACERRSPRTSEISPRERLRVEQKYVHSCCSWCALARSEVVARVRVSVGHR